MLLEYLRNSLSYRYNEKKDCKIQTKLSLKEIINTVYSEPYIHSQCFENAMSKVDFVGQSENHGLMENQKNALSFSRRASIAP